MDFSKSKVETKRILQRLQDALRDETGIDEEINHVLADGPIYTIYYKTGEQVPFTKHYYRKILKSID